jgi:hypothetical protein
MHHALIQVKVNEGSQGLKVYAYAIGGYSVKEGRALTEVERYCQET